MWVQEHTVLYPNPEINESWLPSRPQIPKCVCAWVRKGDSWEREMARGESYLKQVVGTEVVQEKNHRLVFFTSWFYAVAPALITFVDPPAADLLCYCSKHSHWDCTAGHISGWGGSEIGTAASAFATCFYLLPHYLRWLRADHVTSLEACFPEQLSSFASVPPPPPSWKQHVREIKLEYSVRAVTSADGNKSDWMDSKCHLSSLTPVAAFLEETVVRL